MKLTVFDVGQASWNVVDFGDGQLAIFDCGAGRKEDAKRIVGLLRARLVAEPKSRIAFLLISHLDSDHISGAIELLQDDIVAARIDALICNDAELRILTKLVQRLAEARAGTGITKGLTLSRAIRAVAELQRFYRQRSDGDHNFHRALVSPAGHDVDAYPVELLVPSVGIHTKCFCLAPSQLLKDDALSRLETLETDANVTIADLLGAIQVPRWNSATIVIAIEKAGRRALLPGDADARTWAEILTRVRDAEIEADVVVAWHHGGRLGTFKGKDYDDLVWNRVLRKKRRSIVLISHGGERRYGHPNETTLNCVRGANGDVYCTRLKHEPHIDSLDFEMAFPRSKYGHFAELGRGGKPSYYRSVSGACCGDIEVDLLTGAIAGSRFRNASIARRSSNAACCQAS